MSVLQELFDAFRYQVLRRPQTYNIPKAILDEIQEHHDVLLNLVKQSKDQMLSTHTLKLITMEIGRIRLAISSDYHVVMIAYSDFDDLAVRRHRLLKSASGRRVTKRLLLAKLARIQLLLDKYSSLDNTVFIDVAHSHASAGAKATMNKVIEYVSIEGVPKPTQLKLLKTDLQDLILFLDMYEPDEKILVVALIKKVNLLMQNLNHESRVEHWKSVKKGIVEVSSKLSIVKTRR